MRTSGSQLLVLGEFRRSLFDGAAESRLPLLCFLDTGTAAPVFLAEPSIGPKNSANVYVKNAKSTLNRHSTLHPSHMCIAYVWEDKKFQASQY